MARRTTYQHFQLNYAAAPTVPDAPAAPTGTPGNTTVNLSWAAPANNGSAITDYIVTPFIGAVAQAPIDTLSTRPASS